MRARLLAAIVSLLALGLVLAWSALTPPAQAHCDTLDGPVITTAKSALETEDITPVLKWIKAENESELREAFHQTLAVRKLSPDARELADHYFFETLVRIHRAGEGAPYTGLKPAGSELSPAILAADRALETGSTDELSKLISEATQAGLHARLAHALAAKQHADDSVAAGREYVEAYISFVHYAERLYAAAVGPGEHAEESALH